MHLFSSSPFFLFLRLLKLSNRKEYFAPIPAISKFYHYACTKNSICKELIDGKKKTKQALTLSLEPNVHRNISSWMFPNIYKIQLSKQKILLIVILCASDSFQGTACKLSCIGSPLRVRCLKIDWDGKMFPHLSNFFSFFFFFAQQWF